MKKIARRQSEEAQGGEKNKKATKSNMKPRKMEDTAGHCHNVIDLVRSMQFAYRYSLNVDVGLLIRSNKFLVSEVGYTT